MLVPGLPAGLLVHTWALSSPQASEGPISVRCDLLRPSQKAMFQEDVQQNSKALIIAFGVITLGA